MFLPAIDESYTPMTDDPLSVHVAVSPLCPISSTLGLAFRFVGFVMSDIIPALSRIFLYTDNADMHGAYGTSAGTCRSSMRTNALSY